MPKCTKCGTSGLTLKLDSLGLCPICHEQRIRDLERQITTLELKNNELQAFHDEYSVIIDARKEAARLIAEAQDKADNILAESRIESDRIKQEAISLKSSVEMEIKRKIADADQKTIQIKRDSYDALAYVETQIAALLASASKDFAHFGKTSFSMAYISEQKSKPTSSDSSPEFCLLTPSAFRKASKRGYIVFDLETTGLNRSSDRIIEIGAIKYDGLHHELERYQTLVNPGKSIPPSATAINHITNAMVADAPSIQDVLPGFLQFIGEFPLIAHNAGFDISFLKNAALQYDVSHTSISYADSLAMARKVYSLDSYKLGSIAEHLRISESSAHRSIGDCETLGKIVKDMLLK